MNDSRSERHSRLTLSRVKVALLILAICALLAIPLLGLYGGHVPAGVFSEGMAGAGSIRTALRIYREGHNNTYPILTAVDGAGLGVLGIGASDLNGMYFTPANYKVASTATTYMITVTATFAGGATYTIDEKGNEGGNFEEASKRYWREHTYTTYPFAVPCSVLAIILATAGIVVSVADARRKSAVQRPH